MKLIFLILYALVSTCLINADDSACFHKYECTRKCASINCFSSCRDSGKDEYGNTLVDFEQMQKLNSRYEHWMSILNEVDVDGSNEFTKPSDNLAVSNTGVTENRYQSAVYEDVSQMQHNLQTRMQQCEQGFIWNSRKRKCQDIDECMEGTDTCNRRTQLCKNLIGYFTCLPKGKECPPGYKEGISKDDCVDVNECEEGTFDCVPEAQCVNSFGGYYCDVPTVELTTLVPQVAQGCPRGFRYARSTSVCEDIDECRIGQHSCNAATHQCINTNGSYVCAAIGSSSTNNLERTTCSSGFRRNRWGECEDINECERFDNPCPRGQTCKNSVGSYECFCQVGYTKDYVTGGCRDINECQLGTHTCHPSLRCDNTIGSYQCVRVQDCGTGYTINADTDSCEDVDECALGTHNCGNDFQCRNTDGSFRCVRTSCPSGYFLTYDGNCQVMQCGTGKKFNQTLGRCVDVDECERNPCRSTERCINTIGGYKCVAACDAGFEMSYFGNICQDIDECARGTHECGFNQICKNNQGGYICECPTGYALDRNRECVDIDECSKHGSTLCPPESSVCHNTRGSYYCQCKHGFENIGNNMCRDINECEKQPRICMHKCFNTWGSYQCTCNTGYTLAEDNRTCVDIDECEMWENNKQPNKYLCLGTCLNIPGSFECRCPLGYTLGSDKKTCQDIDECEKSNMCLRDEICLNTRGSYKCNRINCPAGYQRDTAHKSRCKKIFNQNCDQDSNCLQAELKEPFSYSYNYLTFVSNITIPTAGYLDLFTMRGPALSVTTVEFDLKLISVDAPPGVPRASRDYFHLRRTAFNEVMVSLLKPIQGPQDIQLELEVRLYHSGYFGGSSKAYLFIFVSENEF